MTVIEPTLLTINDVLKLIFALFLFGYVAYILSSTASFFPRFIASFVKKFKTKGNIDIDYNRDHNKVYFKIPNSRDVKKNHGKRIPFFNKR